MSQPSPRSSPLPRPSAGWVHNSPPCQLGRGMPLNAIQAHSWNDVACIQSALHWAGEEGRKDAYIQFHPLSFVTPVFPVQISTRVDGGCLVLFMVRKNAVQEKDCSRYVSMKVDNVHSSYFPEYDPQKSSICSIRAGQGHTTPPPRTHGEYIQVQG